PASRARAVCADWKAAPIDGRATWATARIRLATAATRTSAARANPLLSGAVDPVTKPPSESVLTPRPPEDMVRTLADGAEPVRRIRIRSADPRPRGFQTRDCAGRVTGLRCCDATIRSG